jgi:hypothetical protein
LPIVQSVAFATDLSSFSRKADETDESVYWKLKNWLKARESALDSCLGANCAIDATAGTGARASPAKKAAKGSEAHRNIAPGAAAATTLATRRRESTTPATITRRSAKKSVIRTK